MALNDTTDQYRLLILRQCQILSALLCIILSYFTFMDTDSQNQDALTLMLSFMGYCIIFLLSFQNISHKLLYRGSCVLTLFLIGYFLHCYPITDSPALPWIAVLPSLLVFFLDGWTLKVAATVVVTSLVAMIYSALVDPQPPVLLSQQHTVLIFVSTASALGYSFFLSFALWNCNNKKHYFLMQQHLRDPLTGAYNRRGLQNFIDSRSYLPGQQDEGMGIIMIDIDDFKQINDQYGHPFGDKVIQLVSQRLSQNIRDADILTRYGGEEFLILLDNISQNELLSINNRIVDKITLPLNRMSDRQLTVTVSGGCVFKNNGSSNAIRDLINKADEKLYEAKNGGKNQILFCSV